MTADAASDRPQPLASVEGLGFPHNTPYGGNPGQSDDDAAAALADEIKGEFLAQYTGNTRRSYLIDLAGWFNYCRDTACIEPLEANRRHVRAFLDSTYCQSLSPATRARRVSTLRGFYRFAATEYSACTGTAADIRIRSPRRQHRPNALTLPQLSSFLDAADERGPRTSGLAWLLATTGIRISEALSARTEDLVYIDDAAELRIISKGGRLRSVPLTYPVIERLEPLVEPGYPIFVTRNRRRWERQSAAKVLKDVALDAGIESRFSPHVLRHTFVTHSLRLGAPLHVVQDAAGHANPATTRRYDHPDPGELTIPSLLVTDAITSRTGVTSHTADDTS